MVLCVDEKPVYGAPDTQSPHLGRTTGPTRPGRTRVHAQGSPEPLCRFDTRTGKVYATTAERKRQVECIAFLEHVDREIVPAITTIHVILDNVRMHKGKQVQAWLAKHPRFVLHFPPVHCSWMNVRRFSILQRKRLQIADFADKKHLAERLMAFVAEWNEHAHPFRWSTKSAVKSDGQV